MLLTDQLLAKASELERVARELRETAALLRQDGDGAGHAAVATPAAPAPAMPPVRRRRKKLGIDVVVEVLRETGIQPLSRDDIVKQSALKGYTLSPRTVATYLSRHSYCKSLARDEWVLASNYSAALQAKKQRLAAAMAAES